MVSASLKRRAAVAAKAAATMFLLGWFLSRVDLSETLVLLERAHLHYVLAPFCIAVVVVWMGALRWQLLLGVLQLRPPLKEICAVTFIGNFFNFLLPSKLGGEAVRAYYGVRIMGRPGEVVLSILIDRYIGLIGLMSLPLAVMFLQQPISGFHDVIGAAYIAVAVALLVAVVAGLLIGRGSPASTPEKSPSRITALLCDLRSALLLYGGHKGVLLQALGISVAIHILNIAIYFLLGVSLGEGGHFLDFYYLIPMVTLAALMPISFGGLGVREWTFVYLFTRIGIPQQTALLISLLNLLISVGTGLIGAAIYVGWRYRPSQQIGVR